MVHNFRMDASLPTTPDFFADSGGRWGGGGVPTKFPAGFGDWGRDRHLVTRGDPLNKVWKELGIFPKDEKGNKVQDMFDFFGDSGGVHQLMNRVPYGGPPPFVMGDYGALTDSEQRTEGLMGRIHKKMMNAQRRKWELEQAMKGKFN